MTIEEQVVTPEVIPEAIEAPKVEAVPQVEEAKSPKEVDFFLATLQHYAKKGLTFGGLPNHKTKFHDKKGKQKRKIARASRKRNRS